MVFGADFKTCIEHCAFFDHDGCVTRLECRPFRTELKKRNRHMYNGTRLRQQMAFDGGTGAYVITREYVEYLLEHHSTPKTPIDDQILNPDEICLRPHIIYQLDPAPAVQRLFLDKSSPLYDPESDLKDGRIYPKKAKKPVGIGDMVLNFFKTRAQNGRRNLFHVSKIVPFSGEGR